MSEIPELLDCLEDELLEREPYYREDEQAVMDVVETIRLLEVHGLYPFWYHPIDHQRIIRSFREVGSSDMADDLEDSQQFEEDILTGDYLSRQEEWGKERFKVFRDLEQSLQAAVGRAYELTLHFVKTKRVAATPLRLGERIGMALKYRRHFISPNRKRAIKILLLSRS